MLIRVPRLVCTTATDIIIPRGRMPSSDFLRLAHEHSTHKHIHTNIGDSSRKLSEFRAPRDARTLRVLDINKGSK